MASSTGELLLH